MSASVSLVAQLAGVSISTVSRALRDIPGISATTRKRVREIADEVGYVPSLAASRLATGKTGTIAVITPNISKWFFGQVIEAAGKVFREAGHDVLLYELADTATRKRFFDRPGLHGRADGVLLLALQATSSELDSLAAEGLPVAMQGSQAPGICGVHVDDREAGRTAARHLLNLGHDHIAFIGIADQPDSTLGGVPPGQRLLGYRDALAEAGLRALPGFEQFTENSTSGGAEAMSALLCAEAPPTAAFVASDEMAFGALSVLRKAGICVPHDISIVGFDNHELADIMDLTTMDHCVPDQGRTAASLLLDSLLAGTQQNTTTAVPTRLVIRGSTAPPRPLRNRDPNPAPTDAAPDIKQTPTT